VAEVWTVDLPLRDGAVWSDWLAEEFRLRVAAFPSVALCDVPPHPRPEEVSIQRFTGVLPFAMDGWRRPAQDPRVVFIWRDDRLWLAGTGREPVGRARMWLERSLRRRSLALQQLHLHRRHVVA